MIFLILLKQIGNPKILTISDTRTSLDSMVLDSKRVKALISVGMWTAAIHLSAVMLLVIPLVLTVKPALGVIYTLFIALLVFVPLSAPCWAKELVAFSIRSGLEYFSVKVIVDDEEAIKPGRPYIASWLPLVRHMFWWLGVQPVSRENISKILSSGKSCALIPGGVREINFMKHGTEVAYLTRRLGFVRLAIQAGAPIIPFFAFGQTAAYSYWRINLPLVPISVMSSISYVTGFQPIYIWGRWFSAIPNKVPITVVIGRPIEVPKLKNPDKETVQKYLDAFIDSMRDLYERYKSTAEYNEINLEII